MQLLAGRPWRHVRPGHNPWPAMLDDEGMWARGGTSELCYWWVAPRTSHEEPAGDRRLVVAGRDGRVTACLDRQPGGHWEGPSLRQPSMRIELRPVDGA